MAEPVLSLDILTERRFVRISGSNYDLVNAGELSVVDLHRVRKRGAKVQALVGKDDEISDAEVEDLHALLDWLCRLILKAPDELHVALNDNHRLAIIQSFSSLQRVSPTAPATEGSVTPSTSIGEGSSLGSSASTAERQPVG